MHPRQIHIADYTYDLPEDKIAFEPLKKRDSSKLLVYNNGAITDRLFTELPTCLPSDSMLVFNQSKVIHARLLFKKDSGGLIEVFCLGPDAQYRDTQIALAQTGTVKWQCLVGGASKWKKDQKLTLTVDEMTLTASVATRDGNSFTLQFEWQPAHLTFAEVLNAAGKIPLPPYIKREPTTDDETTYQTVYARVEGSVAAPTAGLHFSENILGNLKAAGVAIEYVTLHVGAGTFKPVKAKQIADHEMHEEWIDVDRKTIENLSLVAERSIIAVGTTSLRTLESLFHLGYKVRQSPDIAPERLELTQWEIYEGNTSSLSVSDALHALLRYLDRNNQDRLITKTSILIAPGYQFRVIRGLITNFHQPNSTLLLLVAAFIGEDWRKVYDHALRNGYRFLSYGDGSLLWRK